VKALGCILPGSLIVACALPGVAARDADEPFVNSIGMELVKLPAGYRVGRYEVTQQQYERVMERNPSRWPGAQRPVENVDWRDATRFCERLTRMEMAAGVLTAKQRYALPTESQWEYFVADAAREDMVWGRWNGRTPAGTMPVGSTKPNKLGLYDVRGNVWEWCRDWWDAKHNEKVLRGGSWDLVHPEDLEVTYRPVSAAVGRNGNIGFRVVLEEKAPGNSDTSP
jgi:formylglycine-generating enzyme required for sulfatase activity